ncbi:hypothetical protein IG631_03339 [Alternaria alternata]|nr:hypothetical protein IG631_03339 [Alternaria alternata]
MQEATRSASPSHDFDKHGQDHLEMVATRTPPGEPEKQQLAPVMSRGPEVHEKIPLYLFGSVLPLIYQDVGGVDRYIWFVIGYLIPNAALCPFVGALSDLFGRQKVAIVGQVALIIGPIITATANTMNIAIVLWAQLIAQQSDWRYNGILVGVWNFVGLILCIFCYKDPSRLTEEYTARHVLRQVDYIGGILSTVGITLFMMGLQWGASQPAQCGASRPGYRAYHSLLRMGSVCSIPYGSAGALPQSQKDHDRNPSHHLPQWR